MKKILIFVGITFTWLSFAAAQSFLKANEDLVYSFKTKSDKIMELAKDKENAYLVYRFGSKDKVELEYPEQKNADSWGLFSQAYYMRGGGAENEGMEIANISFRNKGVMYVIYDSYHAVDDTKSTGIKVIDTKTNKEIDIKGLINSCKGSLYDLKDDERLKEQEGFWD